LSRTLSRILAGVIRIPYGTTLLVVHPTTRLQRYIAEEVYAAEYEQAVEDGVFTDEDFVEYLEENGFWTAENEQESEKVNKDIETLKIKLFESFVKFREREQIRLYLRKAESRAGELHEQRHRFDHLCCHSVAEIAKGRYLLGSSLRTSAGEPIFPTEESIWLDESPMLERVAHLYQGLKATDKQLREIARTNPWQSMWSMRTTEGKLLGVSPLDYTEEQAALIRWSVLFENIYQHHERPSDDVIADDDALDGWMILQKQKQASQQKEVSMESSLSEKIRNCQEIFIPVESLEDAKHIESLNSPEATRIKRRRLAALERAGGELEEQHMPDSKQKIRQQAEAEALAKMRGKK